LAKGQSLAHEISQELTPEGGAPDPG
jgi:hypothetical protein